MSVGLGFWFGEQIQHLRQACPSVPGGSISTRAIAHGVILTNTTGLALLPTFLWLCLHVEPLRNTRNTNLQQSNCGLAAA